ncbi:MAG: type I toxin-antitoxin system SymE family toxin [Hungatella sp.]|nr:type I toxin-antitoxin system SymE family toxin [Hungatella sp.]
MTTRRMKAYSFTAKRGKRVPQIILQGNWVEQRGFEIGCSVSVECHQNKLVILKE